MQADFLKQNFSLDHYLDELFNKGYYDAETSFHSDLAKLEHMVTFVVTFTILWILFATVYVLLYYIIKPEFTHGLKTVAKRSELVININMNVHHSLVFGLALYTVLFMCNRPFDMFRGEDQCMRTQRPFYQHAIVITFAYYVYDILLLVFFTRDFHVREQKQRIFHHITCWVIYTFTLLGGRNSIMVVHLSQLCELSQVFLNIRNAFAKGKEGPLPLLINLGFFASFTVFRVILFPLLLLMCFRVNNDFDFLRRLQGKTGEYQPATMASKIGWIVGHFVFYPIVALNFYWYHIMLGIAYKMLSGGDKKGKVQDKKND